MSDVNIVLIQIFAQVFLCKHLVSVAIGALYSMLLLS